MFENESLKYDYKFWNIYIFVLLLDIIKYIEEFFLNLINFGEVILKIFNNLVLGVKMCILLF